MIDNSSREEPGADAGALQSALVSSSRPRANVLGVGIDAVDMPAAVARITASEERGLMRRLDELTPSYVWVGLSTPKQERFMATYAGRLNAGIMLGVGAAFDMHSGRTKQAPRWMQRNGLEWCFRLLQEPRRLFK